MKTSDVVVVGAILLLAISSMKPPKPQDVSLPGKVKPLATAIKGNPGKARLLAGFYAAFADQVQRDQGQRVKTTGQLREAHRAGLVILAANTEYQGEPQVGPLIDEILASSLGLEDKPLNYQEASKVLREISLACEQGG